MKGIAAILFRRFAIILVHFFANVRTGFTGSMAPMGGCFFVRPGCKAGLHCEG